MWLRGTQINQVSAVEQVEVEKAQPLLERHPSAGLEAPECQDPVCAQGNPDWGHDGVLRGPKASLDLQGLRNFFEEKLDLPPLRVDRGNRRGCQGKALVQNTSGLPVAESR